MTDDLDPQTPKSPSKAELVPLVPVTALDALAATEPWLAPICGRLRELIGSGFGDGDFVREAVRYIADALPASKAEPWRALLERDHDPGKIND